MDTPNCRRKRGVKSVRVRPSSTLPEMLFILFAGYGFSGYVIWIYELVTSRTLSRKPPPVSTP